MGRPGFRVAMYDTLEEFYLAEALESFRELAAPADFHPELVVRAINMTLEQNKPDQLENTDRLLAAAHTLLAPDALARGFEAVLETIEDLEIDIPMAPRHVATLVGSAVARGELPLLFLFEGLTHLVATGKAETIACVAMQNIASTLGSDNLVAMYDSTKHNVTELFKPGRTKDYVDSFLRNKDLAILADRLA